MTQPLISIVIPVYGCAEALEELHRRIAETVAPLDPEFELVLVDDRSPDDSWARMQRLAALDQRVVAVRLSRNFGQHPAITAGLAHARGTWTVVMDCDLQDRPEDIPLLIAAAQDGNDVVLARRVHKQTAPWRRWTADLYALAMRTFASIDIDPAHGSFSVISAKVRREFLRFRDHDRHYLALLHWMGFSTVSVDVTHAARAHGRSSYSLRRLISHALDGMFFQTTVLLRWIIIAGFGVSVVGAAFAGFLIVQRLNQTVYPGWTSLIAVTLLMSGFIITSTGVTGLYVGRVFEQVRDRPLYVVDRVLRASDEADA